MAEVTERTLLSGRSRLVIREVGHGPPVIVLHGGPDLDHEYLLPELDVLGSDHRLTYYDQRGRGRSWSGETAADVTIPSEMADLELVRESIGASAVAILGHSFGALLALEYAVRHPRRVSHLVLLNPAPASHVGLVALRAHLARVRTDAESARMRALADDADFRRGELGPDAEYARIHFRPAVRDAEQLDTIVGRLRRGFTPAGLVAAREIERALFEQTWLREDYDLLPKLRFVAVPALVLHGDRDLIPVEIAREIADALPGGRLVVLEDCGHFSFLEFPEAVRAAVAELVAERPDPPRRRRVAPEPGYSL